MGPEETTRCLHSLPDPLGRSSLIAKRLTSAPETSTWKVFQHWSQPILCLTLNLQVQGSLLNLSLLTALDSMSPQPQLRTQPHL